MSIIRSIILLLTMLGPATVKEAGESTGRGMFDAADDDDDGGDDAGAGTETEDSEETEDDDAGDETDDDDQDDEDEDDSDDEDSDEEDEDEEDDEDEDDEEEEADEAAELLHETWNAKLGSMADPAPRASLNIEKVSLRADAKKRYEELRDSDEDGKNDAEAIAAIAADMALQVLQEYHQQVAAPSGERVEKNLRNSEVSRRLAAFRKEVPEIPEAIERRMSEIYAKFAEEHGWRKADAVPLDKLYRMAGGRKGKAAKAAKGGKTKKAKGTDPRAAKKAALGAASGPRTIGRTSPKGGGKKKLKGDEADLAATQDHLQRSGSFFTLG